MATLIEFAELKSFIKSLSIYGFEYTLKFEFSRGRPRIFQAKKFDYGLSRIRLHEPVCVYFKDDGFNPKSPELEYTSRVASGRLTSTGFNSILLLLRGYDSDGDLNVFTRVNFPSRLDIAGLFLKIIKEIREEFYRYHKICTKFGIAHFLFPWFKRTNSFYSTDEFRFVLLHFYDIYILCTKCLAKVKNPNPALWQFIFASNLEKLIVSDGEEKLVFNFSFSPPHLTEVLINNKTDHTLFLLRSAKRENLFSVLPNFGLSVVDFKKQVARSILAQEPMILEV